MRKSQGCTIDAWADDVLERLQWVTDRFTACQMLDSDAIFARQAYENNVSSAAYADSLA